MLTASEVQSLVSAAARPWRVSFHNHHDSGVYVNAEAQSVAVPMPAMGMTTEQADAYLSVVYDAIAQARWLDKTAVLRNKEGELEDSLAHAIGSRRAQANAMHTWAGDKSVFERSVFEPLSEEVRAIDPSEHSTDVLKNIAAHIIAAKTAAGESASVRRMIDELPPELRELVDAVNTNTLPASAKEAADEVRRVLDIILPPPPPPDGDGDGGESGGEGGEGSQEQGEGDEDGSDGAGNDGSSDGDEEEGEGKAGSKERPDPTEKLKPNDYKPGQPPSIGADGLGEYLCTPDEYVVVTDLVNDARSRNGSKTPKEIRDAMEGGGSYELYMEHYVLGNITHVEDSSLSNHLRRMIQVKMRTRYENGHMSGKINRRAVHKLCMPTVGDGTWNAKVFRKKSVPKDTTKTAVSLLVDFSGSMGGSKTNLTIKAVGSLCKALGTLHVKHNVLTFTECRNRDDKDCGAVLHIGRCKDYDDVVQYEQVMRHMGTMTARQYQNGDVDAVAFAYKELLKRKEPRKVLIVLSDGYPASDRPGDGDAALKNMTKRIEQEGSVELYGVGIECGAAQYYYSDSVVVESADELESKLIALAAGLFDVNSGT